MVSILEERKRDRVLLLPAKELLGHNLIPKMPESYRNASVGVNTYPIHMEVKAKKAPEGQPSVHLRDSGSRHQGVLVNKHDPEPHSICFVSKLETAPAAATTTSPSALNPSDSTSRLSTVKVARTTGLGVPQRRDSQPSGLQCSPDKATKSTVN